MPEHMQFVRAVGVSRIASVRFAVNSRQAASDRHPTIGQYARRAIRRRSTAARHEQQWETSLSGNSTTKDTAPVCT